MKKEINPTVTYDPTENGPLLYTKDQTPQAEYILNQITDPEVTGIDPEEEGGIGIDGVMDVFTMALLKKKDLFMTQIRTYQRELVASLDFNQGIIETIIKNGYIAIPQIHIRVKQVGLDANGVAKLILEIIDGQQRWNAIYEFMLGAFALKKDFKINGVDYGGLKFNQLPDVVQKAIENYTINTRFYAGMSDEQTSNLFVEILGKNNNFTPQELRNAMLGAYPDYIRDLARYNPDNPSAFMDLFSRQTIQPNGKKKAYEQLIYMPKLSIQAKRMECDLFASELCFLGHSEHIWTKGITNGQHSAWVKSLTTDSNAAKWSKTHFDKLLKITEDFVKMVHNTPQAAEMSAMKVQIMALYAMHLSNRFAKTHKIEKTLFVSMFLKTINKWSDTKLRLWEGIDPETDEVYTEACSAKPLKQLSEYFAGKNKNAIETIKAALDTVDPIDYGITLKDGSDFTSKEKLQKLIEQGYRCYYTGVVGTIENMVGDHYIPKTFGGKTTYDNLVMCTASINSMKLSCSPTQFKNHLKNVYGIESPDVYVHEAA
jgi:5-methylcytosine-specific restriction endonuclease McrA